MTNPYHELIDFHSGEYFASDCFFGEPEGDLILAPEGDWENAIPVDGVVVPDHAVGSNESRGDGVRLNRAKGSSERTSITVEFKKDVPIQRTQSRKHPDKIKYDGEVWVAIRTTAFDKSMKAVLFVSSKDMITSGQSRRG